MNQNKNEAAQEFMKEIVEDFGYTPKGGRVQGSGRNVDPGRIQKYLISAGIGAILFIALIAFFLAGGNNGDIQEIASIKGTLKTLEERMAPLMGLEERIARLEAVKGLKGLAGLEERIIRLEKEGKSLRQEIQKVPSRHAPPEAPKAAPKVEKRFHTVRPGENLYGIARTYGISIDALCRFNKITPKEPIQSGQKLRVAN